MTVQVSRLVDQDINLRLLTGQTLTLTPREHWGMFYDVDSAIFFCCAFGLITFLFPVPPEALISWWMKLSGFTIFLLLFPVIYFMQVMCVALIATRLPRTVVFEPFLLMVTGFLLELCDNTLHPIIFGHEWATWVAAVPFGEQVIGTVLLLEALHIIFCVFVLPRKKTLRISGFGWKAQLQSNDLTRQEEVDAAVSSSPPHGDAPIESSAADGTPLRGQIDLATKSATIQLDGHDMPIPSLLAIEAEEHYVRVWTEGREFYVRQSFSGLISLLGDAHGFSPRRGIWFNFQNVDEIRRDDKGKFLIIPFRGPTTVVPKAKASEIRQLMKRIHASVQSAGFRK